LSPRYECERCQKFKTQSKRAYLLHMARHEKRPDSEDEAEHRTLRRISNQDPLYHGRAVTMTRTVRENGRVRFTENGWDLWFDEDENSDEIIGAGDQIIGRDELIEVRQLEPLDFQLGIHDYPQPILGNVLPNFTEFHNEHLVRLFQLPYGYNENNFNFDLDQNESETE